MFWRHQNPEAVDDDDNVELARIALRFTESGAEARFWR
jgi:hypothetical protein